MPVYAIIRKPARGVGTICHTLSTLKVRGPGSRSEFDSNNHFPGRFNIDISQNRLRFPGGFGNK